MLNSKIYKALNLSAWAFIVLAFIIFAIGIYGKMLNNAFIKYGVQSSALVTGKHEKNAVGKTVQKDYYLDVHFETDSGSVDTYLNTNKCRYDTLNTGDELQIYYLKNNPKTIRLKSSVENFSTALIYNLKSATIFYCKAILHVIIGNARFSILTVTNATLACLKTALHQY